MGKAIIISLFLLFSHMTTTMAQPEKLIPIILKWEGGWAGNIDGMGCTNSGVTLATFRQFYGRNKTCYDLKRITDEQWRYIFKHGYWNKWKADSIDNQSIANLLVDWVFMSGVWGIKYPQRILGVADDGIVGNKTLSAINNHPDQEQLFNDLWNGRKRYFENLAKKNPAKRKFLNGWLRRLSDYKYMA